jgi:hypothetical protein
MVVDIAYALAIFIQTLLAAGLDPIEFGIETSRKETLG